MIHRRLLLPNKHTKSHLVVGETRVKRIVYVCDTTRRVSSRPHCLGFPIFSFLSILIPPNKITTYLHLIVSSRVLVFGSPLFFLPPGRNPSLHPATAYWRIKKITHTKLKPRGRLALKHNKEDADFHTTTTTTTGSLADWLGGSGCGSTSN